MPIKLALIGYGTIAPYYVKSISKNKDIILTAICDTNIDKKDEIERLGYGFVSNYQDIKNVDAVIIATPHNTHHEIAVELLQNGFHVVCEKPLAIDTSKAKLMIDVAKKTGKTLFPAFHKRYNDVILGAPKVSCTRFEAINTENLLDHFVGDTP